MPLSTKDLVTGQSKPFLRLEDIPFNLPVTEPDEVELLRSGDDSPFVLACQSSPIAVLQEMLATHKYSPALLHWGLVSAFRAGNVATAQLLLDSGAPFTRLLGNVIARNQHEESRLALFKLLFDHGWSPNTSSDYGNVLLDSYVTNLPMLRLFLAYGADPNLGLQRSFTSSLGGPDIHSCRALEEAACRGTVEAVQLLLAAGAKIENGNPLHKACGACPADQSFDDPPVRPSKSFDENRIPVMETLVAAGADVNKKEQTRLFTQDYPIVYAVSAGAVERTRWLLSHGADPTLESREELFGNAYDLAERHGSEEMKKLLRDWKSRGLLAQASSIVGTLGSWLGGKK